MSSVTQDVLGSHPHHTLQCPHAGAAVKWGVGPHMQLPSRNDKHSLQEKSDSLIPKQRGGSY